MTREDRDRIIELRKWLQNYFEKHFNYETTLVMPLNKVKEFIGNEQGSLKNWNRTENPAPERGPREYDICIKILSIEKSETPMKANKMMDIMTGGK